MKSGAPLLAKNARNGAHGDLMMSIRPMGCMATLSYLEIRLCKSARLLVWRAWTAMAIRISAQNVRDFVASHRLLWRLSGDAFDRFDLAEQCKRWSGEGFSLTVNGSNFSNAVVVGTARLTTSFVNSSQLIAAIVDADRTAGYGAGLPATTTLLVEPRPLVRRQSRRRTQTGAIPRAPMRYRSQLHRNFGRVKIPTSRQRHEKWGHPSGGTSLYGTTMLRVAVRPLVPYVTMTA